MSKIVADTSVIINGQLINQIESGTVRNSQIIIPQAVLDELQSQASNKKEQGFVGLEKIRKLKELSGSFGLEIIFQGDHLSSDEIKLAGGGRIDQVDRDRPGPTRRARNARGAWPRSSGSSPPASRPRGSRRS